MRDLRWAVALAQAAGLGMVLGTSTALGAGIGYYLDGRWKTGPWLLLLGIMAGMGLGLHQIVSTLRRFERGRRKG